MKILKTAFTLVKNDWNHIILQKSIYKVKHNPGSLFLLQH